MSGDAWVSGNAHYLNIKPFYGLTFFRTKERSINVACGGELFVCFDALLKFFDDHQPQKLLAVKAAIEIAKLHIDLAPEEVKHPFGVCDACDYEFDEKLRNEYEITHCPKCGVEIEEAAHV